MKKTEQSDSESASDSDVGEEASNGSRISAEGLHTGLTSSSEEVQSSIESNESSSSSNLSSVE